MDSLAFQLFVTRLEGLLNQDADSRHRGMGLADQTDRSGRRFSICQEII